MDAAHQEAADAIVIRSAEPDDAAGIAALICQEGVYAGLLQTPDAPNASRLEYHQKVDAHACRLVALAGTEIVGSVGLHTMGPGLRRMHVRGRWRACTPILRHFKNAARF